MQSLASGVETLRRARVADVETTAQVQATLQRTLSASSSLEARMEQAELSQAQAQSAAAEAHLASQRALQQAARLEEEQMKTAHQLQESLSAQAQQAQTSIADATQVALKTAQNVQTLSDTARKAEYTAQLTAAKVEEQIAQLEQKMKEQQSQSIRDAQSAQEAQLKLTQQLQEAQNVAQSTKGMTQNYERQLAEVHEQMKALEHLLIEQRQKGNSLSSQLSAAQDRIGGAERRAQQLQTENEAIKSELKYWNDLYEQDVAVENVGENVAEVESTPKNPLLAAPEISSSSGIAVANPDVGPTMPTFASWSWPHISVEENIPITAPVRGFDVPLSNAGLDTPPLFPPQQRSRRESFGSTIAGSSGTGGNGNGGRGHGHTGVSGVTPSALPYSFSFQNGHQAQRTTSFPGNSGRGCGHLAGES